MVASRQVLALSMRSSHSQATVQVKPHCGLMVRVPSRCPIYCCLFRRCCPSTTRASQFRVILYLIVQHVLDIESRIFSCHESSSSRGRGPHSSRLGRSESSSARPLSAASIGGPELCSATRMISHYVVLQANWCTSAEQNI